CEKVEHHQLVAMNQALLLSYTVGSLLGPSFTAMLMQNFSDNLLFIMIASVSFIYLLMLLRNAGHTPKPVAHWICPYISRHLLSLNPLQARCRRYSRGER
ncbi:hypothetical protein ACW17M_24075, partial [Vreelandella sp. 2A-K22]